MDDLGKHPYFRKHPYKYIHTEIFHTVFVCCHLLFLSICWGIPGIIRDQCQHVFSEPWGIQLMAEGLNQSQSSEFGRCGSDLSGDFWHKLQGLCIYIYIHIQINITYSFMFFIGLTKKVYHVAWSQENRLPMILPFFCWGEARRRDESLDRLGPLEKNGPPWTNRTSLVSVGWNWQNFWS